ncbi:MAG TPA: MerR family transcriptional regulator [Thalassobaculum sp.]
MADLLQSSIAQRRNGKSAAAFRTISEVADDLEVPPHVLRFWETKFNQVRPLKRGGGRRYYRPEDVALLQRIRELLYREGYTIKGVQKLLRDGAGRMPTAGETARAAQSANPVKGGTAHAPDPQPAAGDLPAVGRRTELQSLLQELKELERKLAGALS